MTDLRHVRREALPWRPADTTTECGRKVTSGMATIGRAEWRATAREWVQLCAAWRKAGASAPPGVQRPNVCQVCWETADRWPTWQEDPTRALLREIERESHWFAPRAQLSRELAALITLYHEHPTRFTDLLARTV